MNQKVCIISWNSRGSSEQKLLFMTTLVSQVTVGNKIPNLCNKENFVLKANSYKLQQAVPDFHFFFNPAVKPVQDRGRPKNGMFICVPDSVSNLFKDVSPSHWRIQAFIISTPESDNLLVNSYFPFDERNEGIDNEELAETLAVIQNVINNNQFDSIVGTGDINADLSRNNIQSRTVHDSVNNIDLTPVWDRNEIDFTCTYKREGVIHVSLLDHFFLSKDLLDKVVEASVLHHPENTSDHEPIFCVLESLALKQSMTEKAPHRPKPS